jgi:L-serine dehydratase
LGWNRIRYLCKHNATLSAAEGGCQAEIGVASAMAAASVAAAYDAWAIASNEIESRHQVDLDATIAAMAETAKDMNSKYKETSKAGLALSVTLC